MSFEGMLKHTCTIQLRSKCQKFPYSASAGTPAIGMTVTGATSHKTAVITRLFTGYLVVKDLSGTFTNGEAIASGALFSATLGTVVDYKNEQKEPEYYWMDNQTNVPCWFYYASRNVQLTETGSLAFAPLQCQIPAGYTVGDNNYRVVTTEVGYAGTYDIVPTPRPTPRALHHHELVLTPVRSP